MSIKIKVSNFLNAINQIQGIIERKNTMIILGYIKIDASNSNDHIIISATDTEVDVVTNVEAEVSNGISFLTPFHKLAEIINKLPKEALVTLTYDSDKSVVEVRSNNFTAILSTLNTDEFPVITDNSFSLSFNLPTQVLRKLLDSTRISISRDEARVYLNGLFLHSNITDKESTLNAVATDGHRLSLAKCVHPNIADDSNEKSINGIIIPRKAVEEVFKITKNIPDDNDVTVKISDNKIAFIFSNITLTSNLIDGNFPDYTPVISNKTIAELTVSKSVFREALDRVSVFSDIKNHGIKLWFKDQTLNMQATQEKHNCSETINLETSIEEIVLGVNATYISDVIANISSATINIKISGNLSPILIQGTDVTNELFVVMPMHV